MTTTSSDRVAVHDGTRLQALALDAAAGALGYSAAATGKGRGIDAGSLHETAGKVLERALDYAKANGLDHLNAADLSRAAFAAVKATQRDAIAQGAAAAAAAGELRRGDTYGMSEGRPLDGWADLDDLAQAAVYTVLTGQDLDGARADAAGRAVAWTLAAMLGAQWPRFGAAPTVRDVIVATLAAHSGRPVTYTRRVVERDRTAPAALLVACWAAGVLNRDTLPRVAYLTDKTARKGLRAAGMVERHAAGSTSKALGAWLARSCREPRARWQRVRGVSARAFADLTTAPGFRVSTVTVEGTADGYPWPAVAWTLTAEDAVNVNAYRDKLRRARDAERARIARTVGAAGRVLTFTPTGAQCWQRAYIPPRLDLAPATAGTVEVRHRGIPHRSSDDGIGENTVGVVHGADRATFDRWRVDAMREAFDLTAPANLRVGDLDPATVAALACTPPENDPDGEPVFRATALLRALGYTATNANREALRRAVRAWCDRGPALAAELEREHATPLPGARALDLDRAAVLDAERVARLDRERAAARAPRHYGAPTSTYRAPVVPGPAIAGAVPAFQRRAADRAAALDASRAHDRAAAQHRDRARGLDALALMAADPAQGADLARQAADHWREASRSTRAAMAAADRAADLMP